jgi:hypothetical protein
MTTLSLENLKDPNKQNPRTQHLHSRGNPKYPPFTLETNTYIPGRKRKRRHDLLKKSSPADHSVLVRSEQMVFQFDDHLVRVPVEVKKRRKSFKGWNWSGLKVERQLFIQLLVSFPARWTLTYIYIYSTSRNKCN